VSVCKGSFFIQQPACEKSNFLSVRNIKTGATVKAAAPVFNFGGPGVSHPGGESGITRVSAKTSIMKIFAIRLKNPAPSGGDSSLPME
jgi:hypothetical protein